MELIKFFKNLFNKQAIDDKNTKLTAYHESGHIVIAYFCGYTCESVQLSISEPGIGEAIINYQKDCGLVACITNSKTENELVSIFTEKVLQNPQVPSSVTLILLAGVVAESIYLNGGKVDNNMKIKTEGSDLTKVDNIDFFLSQVNSNPPKNYINENLKIVINLMKASEIWNAIEHLATELINSTDKKLSKANIEKNLELSGYLDYISTIQS